MRRRLNWLFDVVATHEAGMWRRYTTTEVGRVLAWVLGGDEQAGRQVVDRLRAGAPAHPDQVAVLADFFGVGADFFGDDPAAVAAARDTLLERALRDRGIAAYVVCRMSVSAEDRREQLRHALRPDPAAALSAASGGEWSPEQHQAWQDGPFEGSHDSGATMTAGPMSAGQLHTLCRGLVHELELTAPFDAHELCRRLSNRRGRRIAVKATNLGATTGVGHLAPARRVDHILVERDAPAPQQALVIYHELLHLVRGHLSVGDSLTCGLADDAAEAGAYADWREWEAEVGARELARLARERPQPNRIPAGAGPADHAISAAFGFAQDRR